MWTRWERMVKIVAVIRRMFMPTEAMGEKGGILVVGMQTGEVYMRPGL